VHDRSQAAFGRSGGNAMVTLHLQVRPQGVPPGNRWSYQSQSLASESTPRTVSAVFDRGGRLFDSWWLNTCLRVRPNRRIGYALWKTVVPKAHYVRECSRGLSLPKYLLLLDYTARVFREGKANFNAAVAPIFERLGTTAELWQQRLTHLKTKFPVVR
jgi:hypothetical protein